MSVASMAAIPFLIPGVRYTFFTAGLPSAVFKTEFIEKNLGLEPTDVILKETI